MFKSKTNNIHLTDEQLMRRLIDLDDHDALSELYKRYANKILGYFIKVFKGDVQLAQDFLQDLFLKILEKKHLFNPDKKFYTWAFTIAANMCRMSFRNEVTKSVDEVGSDRLMIYDSDLLDQKFLKAQLKEEIYALEYHHRSVFILRYNEGFSLREIAEITESEIGTVKSRLFYATKKLALKLAEHDTRIIEKK